jgi:hypothetical protein
MKNHTKMIALACAITIAGCKKEASVTTLDAKDITRTSAKLYGRVEDDNKRDITSRGIVYATFTNPNINNNKASAGSGTGSFYVTLGLEPNTTYFWRAYATTSKGTSYGDEKSFTTHKYRTFLYQERTMEVFDADNAVNRNWGITDTVTGATNIDDGAPNTSKLAAYTIEHAAKVCDQLTANGHSDWYLPSSNELSVMYTNRFDLQMNNATYWSSTEADSMKAMAQSFSSGMQMPLLKNQTANCRCIRKDQ